MDDLKKGKLKKGSENLEGAAPSSVAVDRFAELVESGAVAKLVDEINQEGPVKRRTSLDHGK